MAQNGEPVTDFDITWWTPAAAQGAGYNEVAFRDREGGSFELTELPEGTVFLLASSTDRPRSATVRVEMGADEEREVLLELPEALRVTGQVVDAESREPVPTAVLQLYTNQGTNYVSPWGSAVAVDADGSFDVAGFAQGQNRYVVEAPGYATLLGDTWASTPGPVELGRVPLFRSQTLTVVLSGDLPEDLSGFRASAIASRFYDPRPFAQDGTVVFEDMGPGRARVFVTLADGGSTWHMVDLVPGEDWLVEVPVAGGPQLQVLVEPEGPGLLPEGLTASATVLIEGGYHNRSSALDDDGIARLAGIPPGDVAVDVWSPEGERIGAAVGRQSRQGGSVHVRLGGRAQTFLVLDREGAPVHGAEVHLYLAGGLAGWHDYGYTDDQGLRTARGFPDDQLLAGIIHPDHGKAFGLPVDLAGAPDPLVLRFESERELALRLQEGGQPRSGVQVRVLGGSGTYIVGWVTSDAEGLVRLPGLGPGSYDVSVLHPGYWQQTVAVAASPEGEPPRPLEVFRLATLRLRARTTAGAPVPGLALELEHAQLGPASAWFEGGLATDAAGCLVLEDVPRGTYRWRASLEDGSVLQGEGALVPGPSSEFVLVVP